MPVEADDVLETLETASSENKCSSLRQGQIVQLPETGEVWMTGDLHDHRANFARLLRAADLKNNPRRHLILHELIHGEHIDPSGAEDSWQTLVRAAILKCDFPDQVHFMLANHDLAQIHGEGILKNNQSVCEGFNKAIQRDFGDRHAAVTVAITEFLLSFPLAARTHTGVFFCHSLPREKEIPDFDYTVFDRELTSLDYKRRVGPVYQLIWGRHIPPDAARMFADKVGARLLITGHQPQDTGYLANGEHHLIIASDHNQGVYLPMDLSATYQMGELVERLQKFVAIDVE